MSNELDPVYFTNHVHRILRPSDDAVGEASAHGLSLSSNVQIGTTGAALKIFKLDSTGNLTTSNNFLLKGVGGATSNTVTILGKLTVESGNGLVVNSQSGITVTSSNTGNVFMRLQRPTNEKDAFVHFTPSGTLSATNPEFRLGYTSGTTGLTINRFDGTTSVNMLTMTSAGLVNITSGVTISGNLNVTGVSTMSSLTTTGNLTVEGKLTFTEYNHYTPSLSTEKGYWSNTAAGPVAVTGITTTGWYKIASITCPTSGAYRGANFKGSILRYNTNWGEAIPTELFFSGRIVFYNAPSTPLQDTGVFYLTEGFNDNLLRLAKVADASWELQLGAYTTNVAIAWEVEPLYLGSQVTFTHFDRAAASLPVSIVTPTTQYHSRVGDTLGRSLDLTSTLVVDGRTDINNQFFVSTTNDQIAGFTGSGTASTGSLSLYYYKRDNATPYVQDKTMLYLGGGQTGGIIYSAANASASHLWHVGGFNSTSSERMRLSNDGLRINLASDLTTNGALASDDLQVNGTTYLNNYLAVKADGGLLKLVGTTHNYIEFYPTGTSGFTAGRSGYIGFSNPANRHLNIVNSETTGSIILHTSGTNRFSINSSGTVLVGDAFDVGSSFWAAGTAQVILGGTPNQGFNTGTGTKLLITGYNNQDVLGESDIYPLYLQDENANTLALADFWVRAKQVVSPARNSVTYIGGDLGINTTTPAVRLDVKGDTVLQSGVTISGSLSVTGASTLRGNANFLGNVVVGTGTSSYDLDVDGLARAKSYLSSVTASTTGTNFWFELGSITFDAQYQDEAAALLVSNRGGSGSDDQSAMAQVFFRAKQQNPMASSPFVDLLVPWSAGRISAQDFVAVVTQDDASAKVIRLMARLVPNFDELRYTVFNRTSTDTNFTLNYLPTGSATLITGVTSYTGIGGFYTSSTGAVGIGTVSPASGLDVNDNAVFRSGVTISGALSLNTITTTGTINANSLNVGGNASVTGTLGVSGVTTIQSSSAEALKISSTADHGYIAFYPSGVANARSAYLGFSSAGNRNFNIVNESVTGSLSLATNSVTRVFISSGGLVGINTAGPNSGLDVASDTVFRSGVTVSGTLGVTGTTSLDDLLATGAATFRNGVTVSGLTSLNTLTTTGVVNANSLNVSGDSIISGNLGVYNTATFENLVADPASTNLLTYSENFADGSWVVTTATKSTTASVTKPDGTLGTVDAIIGSSADSRVNKTVTGLVAGQTYTFSIWIRAVSTAGSVNIYITDTSGSTVTSCNYTSSFQRFSVTRTLPVGITQASVQIGGGGTLTSGESINLWGAQLENKPYATSYIPTVADAVSAGDALELKYPISRTVVANSLEVTGALGVTVANGYLYVKNGSMSYLYGGLTVDGPSIIQGDLEVRSAATFKSGVTISGSASASSPYSAVVSGVGCRSITTGGTYTTGTIYSLSLQAGMVQGFATKVDYAGVSGLEVKIYRTGTAGTPGVVAAADLLYWSGSPTKHVTGDIDTIPFELWGLNNGTVYVQIVAGSVSGNGIKLTSVRLV